MRSLVCTLQQVAVAWAALFLALPVQGNGLSLAPSPLSTCLVPPAATRGTPEYPAEQWKNGQAGRVVTELIFTGPQLRPEFKVIESSGDEAFIDAVRRHVRDYRLPCLEDADIPARVRLEFDFRPTERTLAQPEATDPSLADRRQLLKCVVNTRDRQPGYPSQARMQETQGRVLVTMRFVSADGPPEVTVLSRPASAVFVAPAREWAAHFRMPCFNGLPLNTQYTLVYRMEGAGDFGFRDLSLVQFVASIRNIREQRVFFDFNTMACPFEVRLQYLQPQRRNRVIQINQPHPARRAFLDWLADAELKLSERSQDAVFGDNVVLQIPCSRLNLQPQSAPPPSPPTQEKS